MCKVAKMTATAFKNGEEMKIANSETNGRQYWLHGNEIAFRANSNTTNAPSIAITPRGCLTKTTFNRLNTILMVFGFNYRVAKRADYWIVIDGETGDILPFQNEATDIIYFNLNTKGIEY